MLCKVSHKLGHVPVSLCQYSGLSKLPFRNTHTYTDTPAPPPAPAPPYKVKLSQPLCCRSQEGEGERSTSLPWIWVMDFLRLGSTSWIIWFGPQRLWYCWFWTAGSRGFKLPCELATKEVEVAEISLTHCRVRWTNSAHKPNFQQDKNLI